MAQLSVLKAAGIYSADNPYSAVPEGALVKAENAVIRYRGVVQPRRGQKYWDAVTGTDTTFGGGSDRSNEGYHWGSAGTVIHSATTALGRVVTASGYTAYSGSYTPVDATMARMRFVEAASNLYFNTTVGNYLLDSITGTPALAGVPKGQELYDTSLAQLYWFAAEYHANGFLAPDKAVAYRFVWGIKDSHDNVKLGPPSGRYVTRNKLPVASGGVVRAANVVTVAAISQVATNDIVELINDDATFGAGPFTVTAGVLSFTYPEVAANANSAKTYYYGWKNASVDIQIPIPSGITTSHFVRVYRTAAFNADDDPSEEFYLVNELIPSSSDISTGYLLSTDYTPDSQLDVALYTNPNDGNGAEAAKFQPPIGKDMCWWDNRLWMFNTTDKHRFQLRLLGVGSPDGVQANDTITINGQAFTAKTSSASGFQFLITTTETSSRNVELSALSLVTTINRNSGTVGVVAFYVSGEDDAPGNILLEATALGASSFTVYASRAASWGPALTTSSTGAKTSANDRRKHAASFSDVDEPEAFPLLQWVPIAPNGVELLRGIPFRDKLYVFAENGKAYSVSGPFPYRVDELDGSAPCLAPDTVVLHNNQIFALTDQGVGVLSDAGLRIVSKGPEDELLDVLGITLSVLKRRAFAVSYESERQVTFWVPTASADTCATKGFAYNPMENTWTTHTASRTWGRVNANDRKLYMGDGATNKLRQERKNFDRTDYADEAVAVTIDGYASPGLSVTLSTVTGVAVGDVLYQSLTSSAGIISAVDIPSKTVTLGVGAGLIFAEGGAAQVLKAFTVTLKWAPVAPAGPCILKDFQDVTLHFRELNAYKVTATFDTESYSTESTADVKQLGYSFAIPASESGLFTGPPSNRNRRVEVPQSHESGAQLRVGFSVREAWAIWALHGFTLNYNAGGDGGRA